MHEYPITEQIVKIAEKNCKEAGASRVISVNLVVGDYSGLVPESIHMYFDLIAEGTVCEGAEINMKRIKPKLKCPSCGALLKELPCPLPVLPAALTESRPK